MNLPFFSVFLVYLITYFTKIPVAKAMAKQPGGYDNRHPRDQQAALEGWGKRAVSAHANGFECLIGFAPAVIMAEIAGMNPLWLTALCGLVVISRLIYIALYLLNKSTLRSAVWSIGFFSIIGIYLGACFS